MEYKSVTLKDINCIKDIINDSERVFCGEDINED